MNKNKFLCVLTALVLTITSYGFLGNILNVNAEETKIKTTQVWDVSSSDSKITGSDKGSILTIIKGNNATLESKIDTENMKIIYKVNGGDKYKFNLKSTSPKLTSDDIIDNNLTFTTKGDKFEVVYDDETAITNDAFKIGADITFECKVKDAEHNVLLVNGILIKEIENIKYNIANFRIEAIEKLDILVKSINGQSLVDNEGITDTVSPIIRFHNDKIKDGDYVTYGCKYAVSFTSLDVLTSDCKSEVFVNTVSNTDETKDGGFVKVTEKDNKVVFSKADYGVNIVKVLVKDKSGKPAEIQIKLNVGDIVLPEFADKDDAIFDKYQEDITALAKKHSAGEAFYLPMPKFTDNKISTGLLKFEVSYKLKTASSFTKTEGLKFVPSKIGAFYEFKIQAKDISGKTTSIENARVYTAMFYDSKAPKITITSSFPDKAYKGVEVTIPSASISDYVDSDLTKTTVLEFKNGENWEVIKLDENSKFTPEKLGTYRVTYTACDESLNKSEKSQTFQVVEPVKTPIKNWAKDNVPSIVFISIALVSALGIVALIFIKPKKTK